MQTRIFYEDTDCGGIVYHANYFKFCERARSDIFFSLRMDPYEASSGFVVRSLKGDFIGAAMLGDIINITTKILKVKNVSALLKQEIHKVFDNTRKISCEEKIFEAEVKLGYINFTTQSPILIPKKFLEVLNEEQ